MAVVERFASAAARGRALPPGSVAAPADPSRSFHPSERLPCPAGEFLPDSGAQAHQEESLEHHR
jgi:hypothetical protein